MLKAPSLADRVRRGVVSLPGSAESRRHGREDHEELQLELARALVQEPRAGRFRGEDSLELTRSQLLEQGVGELTGGMNDPHEPRSGAEHLAEQPLHLGFAPDVTSGRDHSRAALLQASQRLTPWRVETRQL